MSIGEEGVLVGDGLTILSTATIEEAQKAMEEEPLIKPGAAEVQAQKIGAARGSNDDHAARIGQ
jgi:hypothetical protein